MYLIDFTYHDPIAMAMRRRSVAVMGKRRNPDLAITDLLNKLPIKQAKNFYAVEYIKWFEEI